jgi:hypothetical protein
MAIKRTKENNKLISKLEGLKNDFEDLKNKHQEFYDMKSIKWQESEKGQETQDNINILYAIESQLEDLFNEASDLFEEQ